MRALATILLFVAIPALAVEVYRQPDQGDGVEFSDKARSAAERVTVPEAATYTSPRPTITLKASSAPGAEGAPLPYTSFQVLEPPDEATLWDNNGDVRATLLLEPGLQSRFNHRLVLLLDGRPTGPAGADTEFALTGVDRGSHRLQAQVLDNSDTVIASSPMNVFHLHRTIVPRPKPQKPPKGPKKD
jgi:hypothetical protein